MSEKKKETILEEAQRHVYGDRAASHGPFDRNFEICAQMYNAWTGGLVSSADVAKILICLKAARHQCNPEHRDNLVDLAGYAELLFRLSESQLDKIKGFGQVYLTDNPLKEEIKLKGIKCQKN